MAKKNKNTRRKPASAAAVSAVLPPRAASAATIGNSSNVPAAIAQFVTTDVQISKDDVLSVALVQAEDHMVDQVTDACRRRDAASEQAGKLRAAAEKRCYELGEARTQDGRSEVTIGLKAFGIKNVTFNVGVNMLTGKVKQLGADNQEIDDEVMDDGDHTSGFVSVEPTPAKSSGMIYDKFRVRVTCLADTREVGARVYVIPYPTDVVEMLRSSETEAATANAAAAEAVEWKKRSMQMPSLERRYRARLAETRIAQAEGGQELLDTILGDVRKDVLRLSVNR